MHWLVPEGWQIKTVYSARRRWLAWASSQNDQDDSIWGDEATPTEAYLALAEALEKR